MLEKFTYTNHMGEVLEFGKGSLFVNENDLRDFAWEITSKNNKISGFKKGIVSKTIPVILKCETEYLGVQMRNSLFEVFEKDVLAQKHGKIQIGDYYLRCYITGSKKSQYLITQQYMLVTLTVQTDYPMWVKETTTSHTLSTEVVQGHLDYPHGFPYDFKNPLGRGSIYNGSFVPCNFILTIYGYAISPEIYIGGHKYLVNVDIGENDYLTINSIDKTIILTKTNGEQVNCFNNRDRDSYIFEKIPVGTSTVTSANGQIQFTLTVLEERSEPRWT